MKTFFQNFIDGFGDVAGGLPTELTGGIVGTILALVISYLGWRQWERRKWGNWKIQVFRGDEKLGERPFDWPTAKRILTSDWDFGVTVKGFASSFGWLNADVVEQKNSADPDAEKLCAVNTQSRVITIQMANNPKPSGPPRAKALDVSNAEDIIVAALASEAGQAAIAKAVAAALKANG